jgi:RNA polymerase sigma-70 factor, ECF subfamily
VEDLTRLLLAARDGDRVALGAAIRAGQAEVWRLAACLVGRSEADDLTQETFLRAFRALPGFRAESSGRTWLLSIARRACVDAMRQAGRRRRLAARIEAYVDPAGGGSGDQAGLADVESLVAGLDRDRRLAFVLTQVVGCSYAEAAAIGKVPIGTIRSRVARARAELVEEVRAAAAG